MASKQMVNILGAAVTLLGLAAPVASPVNAQPIALGGVACQTPAPEHCPDQDCPTEVVISAGGAIEPKTKRPFFLDYPCDLKPGEQVTFILSLHGAGSYGNWQRHYFPLLDYKDAYRLAGSWWSPLPREIGN